MRVRVPTRLAALLGAVFLVVASTPAAHATGGPGGAGTAACNPTIGGTVGASSPVPVAENAVVNCPMASGPTGSTYGHTDTITKPTLTQGQDCSYVVYRPVRATVTNGGGAIEHDPNLDGSAYTSLSYPPDLAPILVTAARDSNIYQPSKFVGKADANGQCTVPNPGWTLGCPDPVAFSPIPSSSTLCWFQTPNTVTGGGINPGAIAPFLDQARLLQFINTGTMASRPDNPHAGVVNTGTCFFVQGASFQAPGGAPQNIQQAATFEMNVSQPVNDGTGRFIFYVIRITLSYTGADWDFGDGSSTPDPTPPSQCAPAPGEIVVAHTYKRYGAFNVTITEHFQVDVEQFWDDSAGEHGPIPLNIIPPIARTLGVYTKQVIQEEGVPVG